jgi:hypothetical protein
MRFAAVCLSALALAGCETGKAVQVSGDSLCRVVKKDDLTWSVGDTKRTIHNLRRLGAKRDRICG